MPICLKNSLGCLLRDFSLELNVTRESFWRGPLSIEESIEGGSTEVSFLELCRVKRLKDYRGVTCKGYGLRDYGVR